MVKKKNVIRELLLHEKKNGETEQIILIDSLLTFQIGEVFECLRNLDYEVFKKKISSLESSKKKHSNYLDIEMTLAFAESDENIQVNFVEAVFDNGKKIGFLVQKYFKNEESKRTKKYMIKKVLV